MELKGSAKCRAAAKVKTIMTDLPEAGFQPFDARLEVRHLTTFKDENYCP
jgi:hypothetical protein